MKLAVDALKFVIFAGLYRLLTLAGVALMMIFAGGMVRVFLSTVEWIAGLLT